jgi:hypothetical protein
MEDRRGAPLSQRACARRFTAMCFNKGISISESSGKCHSENFTPITDIEPQDGCVCWANSGRMHCNTGGGTQKYASH